MVLFYSLLYEKGKRSRNEDSVVLQRMETRAGEVTMALICDGMGGEDRGELASGYLAECLSVWFYDKLPQTLRHGFNKSRIQRSLQRSLFTVHEELRGFGLENSLRCGTTMTMLLMVGRRYLVFQCGDSLAYAIRRRIKPLTPRQGDRRGVERCIGIGSFRRPHMSSGYAYGNQGFRLHSDGFGDRISTKDMLNALGGERIKEREDADKALRALAGAGMRRGCGDNMSAIYLKCS